MVRPSPWYSWSLACGRKMMVPSGVGKEDGEWGRIYILPLWECVREKRLLQIHRYIRIMETSVRMGSSYMLVVLQWHALLQARGDFPCAYAYLLQECVSHRATSLSLIISLSFFLFLSPSLFIPLLLSSHLLPSSRSLILLTSLFLWFSSFFNYLYWWYIRVFFCFTHRKFYAAMMTWKCRLQTY